MKIWTKVKEFCEKHMEGVVYTASIIVGATASVYLYRAGYNQAVKNGTVGLNMCYLAKPELKPMMEEALKTVAETTGK